MFPNNLCKVSQVSSMSQTVMLESNFVNFNKWPSQVLYRPSPPSRSPSPTLALKSFSLAKSSSVSKMLVGKKHFEDLHIKVQEVMK